MAEYISSYSITEFKKLKVKQLKRLKSCEITCDGEYLFTFMNATTDYIRKDAEAKGQLSNSLVSADLKTLEEILGEAVAIT